MDVAGPRVYGIAAEGADVVAVIRRGPTDWCEVGRWDVAAGVYEPGGRLHGRIYPQRCDLSPDGAWLCYFALQPAARWELGPTYVAISRLPWLFALAAWRTDGTWTRGVHFVSDPSLRDVAPADHGSVRYDRLGAGLAPTPAASYAVERRRGWTEAPGSPPRNRDDVWDDRRAEVVRMRKPHPSEAGLQLEVSGGHAAFRSRGFSTNVAYGIVAGGEPVELAGVQWADWASDGRLLVATAGGRLETRTGASWHRANELVADLSVARPEASAAPLEARRWL